MMKSNKLLDLVHEIIISPKIIIPYSSRPDENLSFDFFKNVWLSLLNSTAKCLRCPYLARLFS